MTITAEMPAIRHHHNDGWLAGCRRSCCVSARKTRNRKISLLVRSCGQSTPHAPVDAEPVRKHLLALCETGHTMNTIAQVSKVPEGTLRALMFRSSPRVTRRTADLVLRTPVVSPWRMGLDLPDNFPVPAVGTVRRLRALVWMGYSARDIAERSGVAADTVRYLVATDRPMVMNRNARDIAGFYREALRRPRPTGTQALRANARATRNGWQPPGVWDDIDDPDTGPEQAHTALVQLVHDHPGLTGRELSEIARTEIGMGGDSYSAALRAAVDAGEIVRRNGERGVIRTYPASSRPV